MNEEVSRSEFAADAREETPDEHMARRMAQRRPVQSAREVRSTRPVKIERRTCNYCHQPGDHPTPAHCLRALER
jgi:hypothetical protein